MLNESHTSFLYTLLSFVVYIGLYVVSQFDTPKEINIPSKLKLEDVKLNFEKKTILPFDRFINTEKFICPIKQKPQVINPNTLLKLKNETLDLNNRARDIKSRVRLKKAIEKAHHEIVDKKKL